MGAILGMGLSHFPGFLYPDDDMVMRVKQTLRSPSVPEALRDPRNWPAPMQAEWGNDEGTAFAGRHRSEYFASMRRLRASLDAFNPDVVVIFGDDQYENFQEDLVPPFCVYIAEQFETQPFLKGRGTANPPPNIWGEPNDKVFVVPGHPQAARYLTRELFAADFDIPYAYKSLHHPGLGHAFIRTVQYLDCDRQGWRYPVIPFHVNAYGSKLVGSRGGVGHLSADGPAIPDPPAPSPRRCFQLGQAIARSFAASPWRVALIGSSSWSHAFLTEKHHWVYPDVASDRERFAELEAGDFAAWRDITPERIEEAGQHEMLNWLPLVGAMYELGQPPAWCEFLETYLMNSCKCVALFPPVEARVRAEQAV
jgi:hypothetical protein